MKRVCADNLEKLSLNLAREIAVSIDLAIKKSGKANISLAGGSTPAKTMNELSKIDLDWSKVTITLCDDRWLPETNERSNHYLIKNNMLINKAAKANFIPLHINGLSPFDAIVDLEQAIETFSHQFDVCLLGMGNDGHFASLFPDSSQLQEGLTTSSKLIAVQSPSIPESRISMTLSLIGSANRIFLLISGQEKINILDNIISHKNTSQLPIEILIDRYNKIEIYQAD